jgi:hypothetical protein
MKKKSYIVCSYPRANKYQAHFNHPAVIFRQNQDTAYSQCTHFCINIIYIYEPRSTIIRVCAHIILLYIYIYYDSNKFIINLHD